MAPRNCAPVAMCRTGLPGRCKATNRWTVPNGLAWAVRTWRHRWTVLNGLAWAVRRGEDHWTVLNGLARAVRRGEITGLC